MVKCPRCNGDVKSRPTRKWSYGNRKVEHYICDKCDKGFNLYISKSSQYTIPKSKK